MYCILLVKDNPWMTVLSLCCCRTCLRYFLPPNWIMDKDAISTMALPELAAFPLDDFFDHYEKGLRKVSTNQLSNNKYSWTLEAWTQMARTLWISWPVVLVRSILPLIPKDVQIHETFARPKVFVLKTNKQNVYIEGKKSSFFSVCKVSKKYCTPISGI